MPLDSSFIVRVPIASFMVFKVEADNEEEAKEIVGNGDGEYRFSTDDPSWDEDSNNWEVEKEDFPLTSKE